MDIQNLLEAVRFRLEGAFGSRLRGAYLYGSHARGEATPDSDVDILVLLDGEIAYGSDLAAAIDSVYPVVLDWGVCISPRPASFQDFERGACPLFGRVAKEGVSL